MNYQAVIFDLDGTLLNTIDDIGDAVNRVLADNHYPTHSMEDYKIMVGLGIEQLVERALPADARNSRTLNNILAQARQAYGANWDNKTIPYDGIDQLLTQLKKQQVKLAVFSNKPHDFTTLCVNKLLPGELFDFILGAKDDVPKKPAPDGALDLARQFGLSTDAILYVGDTNTDMQTAKAAGMTAVGVTWGFRSEKELAESGADHIIHTPLRLLDLL